MARCFSTASMRTEKTKIEVRSISMRKALGDINSRLQGGCHGIKPSWWVVRPSTRAAAAMPPSTCEKNSTTSSTRRQHTDQPQRDGDGRVEKTTRDAVEHPSGRQQRHAERQRNEHDRLVAERRGGVGLGGGDGQLGRLGAALGEEEEHRRADESPRPAMKCGWNPRRRACRSGGDGAG